MDAVSYIVLLIIAVVVSIISGTIMMRKYFATKQKKYLIMGLILTLIIPGVIIFAFYLLSTARTCYAPVCYSEYLSFFSIPFLLMAPWRIMHRTRLIAKYNHNLSPAVLKKIR